MLLSHPAALSRFYLGKEVRGSLGVVFRALSAWQCGFSCPEHVLDPCTSPAGSVLMELSHIGDAPEQEVLTLAKCGMLHGTFLAGSARSCTVDLREFV